MTLSLNKDKIRFLLLEGVHDNALKVLNEAGYTNIEYIKTALDEDELIEKIKDAHFIGIRSRTQLTRKVLESAEKLICIGCFCIGTNQVDLDAALELGIPVLTPPTQTLARSPSWCLLRPSCSCVAFLKKMRSSIVAAGTNLPKTAMKCVARPWVSWAMAYRLTAVRPVRRTGMKVIYHDVLTNCHW
ncbi:D-3-phosphoglycerate dehydrogenase [Moraxella caprae]|uniref:D-3-phosphoglycerate dehydrogenase n=1 Tax=Moraxella caprae TaxID=90240 RepID=A0A378U4T5_9GAMM|nr:D-3-phosphoglycerate dehydrogenase [Moraxella caprae]